MGFYNTFLLTNASGQHTFDGVCLSGFGGGYQIVEKRNVPDGILITVRKGNNIIVDNVLLHFNGRPETVKDLTKDTVCIDIAKIATCPDDMQSVLFQFDRVPRGYRKNQ